MKLNKLVYFAQGHHLAAYNEPLFDENVLAWEHGPVVKEVYETFKICGRNPIFSEYGSFDIETLTAQEVDFLTDIALYYGKFTASYLRNKTHNEGPWERHFLNGTDCVMPVDEIKAFFDTQPPLELEIGGKMVGYIDEEGYTVLPKEWDDDWQ